MQRKKQDFKPMNHGQSTFSPAAQRSFEQTVFQAGERQVDFVTASDQLTTLLADPTCDATATLRATGVDIKRLRRELSRMAGDNGLDHDGGQYYTPDGQPTRMSTGLYKAIARAGDEAARDGVPEVTTRQLLLGIVQTAGGQLGVLLSQLGVHGSLIRSTPVQVDETGRTNSVDGATTHVAVEAHRQPDIPTRLSTAHFTVSPVFLGLAALTFVAGFYLYRLPFDDPMASYVLFAFVTAGWIVSLALHEFGHALVAYIGGDYSVVGKGYLSLNPLKYTHGVLSIVLPVAILLMGGIGLPGGAVFINRNQIRSRGMNSLVSAAGPMANMAFAALLAFIYFLLWENGGEGQNLAFWAAMVFLVFLQVTAIVLNLLPMPGLDGFGILEPWLPESIHRLVAPLYRFGFFILFGLFFYAPGFSRWFWSLIARILALLNIDPAYISVGYDLYQFWR
jgi:Zn-dependent protease